jgi:hypothetical protein
MARGAGFRDDRLTGCRNSGRQRLPVHPPDLLDLREMARDIVVPDELIPGTLNTFLMPIAGVRFRREDRHHLSASVGLTLGDMPGLLIAAYLVMSLPLTAVRWVVLFMVFLHGDGPAAGGEARGQGPATRDHHAGRSGRVTLNARPTTWGATRKDFPTQGTEEPTRRLPWPELAQVMPRGGDRAATA